MILQGFTITFLCGCAFPVSSDGYDLKVCQSVLETDFLINVPVLKAHCQTLMTCCLKNMKGCIPDSEKRRYHTLGIHGPTAALNAVLPKGFCVVDSICGDLTFEEGGNPVESNRIILGRDPVLTDSYCAGLIGRHPQEIDYLNRARKLGIGQFFHKNTAVQEMNTEKKTRVQQKATGGAARYQRYIQEDCACSACYASLIHALHQLDSKKLKNLDRLFIGQGFQGKTGPGIGVGRCTAGLNRSIPGCPPKGLDILEYLKNNL